MGDVMSKKKLVIILCCLIILGVIFSVIYFSNRPDLEYIVKESCFHDFKIEQNNVYLICDIQVKNNTAKQLSFYLLEDASEERLVLEDKIYAYNPENLDEKQLFIIEPHTTKVYKNVYLKGTSTGEKQRENRNPPQVMEFEVVE